MKHPAFARLALVAAAGLSFFAAHAQSTSTGSPSATGQEATSGTRNEADTTPRGMPPGAEQSVGNKAAVPASAPPQKNPDTLSTPGQVPGERAPDGNKAMTPKGDGDGSGSTSR